MNNLFEYIQTGGTITPAVLVLALLFFQLSVAGLFVRTTHFSCFSLAP